MLNKDQRIVCAIGALFFLFIGLSYLSEEKRIFTGIISVAIGFFMLFGSLSGGNAWVDLKNWFVGLRKNKIILGILILLGVFFLADTVYRMVNNKNNARTFNTEEQYTPSPPYTPKFKTGRFRNLFKSKF